MSELGDKIALIGLADKLAEPIKRIGGSMTQCLVCSHWHTSLCGCCDESDYYEER